jgi:hypothetical protein
LPLRTVPPQVPEASTDATVATLGRIFAEHYGCPTAAAEVALEGGRLEASFHTLPSAFERQLDDGGLGHLIEDMRHAFQEAMAPQFKAAVEEFTGHRVLSQTGSYLSDRNQWRLVFILNSKGGTDA